MNNTLHTFKIFHEVNLYPTCGQSAQDQQACLLCGPFKYKTSIRSTSQHQSFHESFYSVAGRAARATFDALAASGVNAQLDNSKLYVTCYRHFAHTHTHTHTHTSQAKATGHINPRTFPAHKTGTQSGMTMPHLGAV